MTDLSRELRELAVLSEKATQGEIFPSQPVFEPKDQAYDCALFVVEPTGRWQIFAECFGRSDTNFRHPSEDNAQFIAALVNFFRANKEALLHTVDALDKNIVQLEWDVDAPHPPTFLLHGKYWTITPASPRQEEK